MRTLAARCTVAAGCGRVERHGGEPAMTSLPDLSVLGRPFQLGGLHLDNRLVMAPMTREFAPDGVLIAGAEDYYARRVRGGVGLVITEGTAVRHPVAHHSARVPHFYGEAALLRWKAVVDAVHAAGGKIFPQLWHTGLYRQTARTANPDEPNIAPSIVGKEPVRPMVEKDIADVIAAFAEGAANARALGFDGVAIHGAHGYLLDQFMWTRTNKRTDGYGGDAANRVRFAAELVGAVRAAVGPDFPILFRFSQWKGDFFGQELAATPGELEQVLLPLADAGVDIFDASTRRFWLPEFDGSDLNLAGWAKKITGKPSMAVGSVGLQDPLTIDLKTGPTSARATTSNLDRLVAMMERDEFDLIAMGRVLLFNPSWLQLVASGAFDQIRSFDFDRVARFLEPADEA